jgi:MFS family permease
MLAILAAMTSLSCLTTAFVHSYKQLAWSRAFTGCGIGGALPIIYSMIGDWFPAARRATGSAMIAASMGGGVFLGQCIAALFGATDWRFPFVLVAVPCFICAWLIELTTEEPARGGQEDSIEALYQHTGVHYKPKLSMRHLYVAFANRTNLLIIFQAFPGNVPWGVIMVYLHDFLIQDLGLTANQGLLAITVLAGSAFIGVVSGGWIGEKIYARGSQHLLVFCAVCNGIRALPFFFLFGWARTFGPLSSASTTCYVCFFILLGIAGCLATLASAGSGAMLLNVNLPEIRGYIAALYSVLDDVSKGLGVLVISALIPFCGGRAAAYQYSLLLWLICGVALLLALKTYEEDEKRMKEYLEEVAMECMVRISKRNAQQAIKRCAKAAGEVHLKDSYMQRREASRLKWDQKKGKSERSKLELA